ncbi:hypothetical protein PMCNE_04450 [Pasteurella multocida]|uniref:hypothetical protein n=1 Tax=Pasteurella multocida TaxID=747 RepID=UPI00074407F6|nr:hypothetical protein [Pasteurella multocida]KUM15492.1 hypothetical protein ASV60_00115 [Pasteurella multocida]MCL7757704.1 ArsR family transcriptional regulator [Pasteurella multocida]MCL7820221.1 ArsR family transcriptional regulator [Pasteurella multocida]TAA86226.1 hypothetical protein PMCNE_04450 [Pasteurella multocida]HDR1059025.1 ArsR family transcriptional regulator [Pasteurella multocida]
MGVTAERIRENKKGGRAKLKRDLNSNTFSPLRLDVVNSPQFIALSASAKTTFIHLLGKYNGKNNGDLSAPLTQAKISFGIADKTLQKGLTELQKAGFVEVTRQGNKNKCSLYALTCFPEHYSDGRRKSTESTAKDSWKK